MSYKLTKLAPERFEITGTYQIKRNLELKIFGIDGYSKTPFEVPVFFYPNYLRLQSYDNLLITEWRDRIFCVLEASGSRAKSLPMSPFGSFMISPDTNVDEFCQFHAELVDHLKKSGVRELSITHPTTLYSSFVPVDWLLECGYEVPFTDTNQHIDLTSPYDYHDMEKRKLKKLGSSHVVRRLDPHAAEKFHTFVAKARQQQGLVINIDLITMNRLLDTFPDHYDLWVTERNGNWTSAVLTVKVTGSVVYYYLPATAEQYRSESPMVLLLDHLCRSYGESGFRYFDLGISSIRGRKQSGLYQFKSRMGALDSDKPTLLLKL